MLLMDVKSTFDHIRRSGLMKNMDALEAGGDLVRWTASFILERKVSSMVDGHQCEAIEVETAVPQGLPVIPILFAISQRVIFQNMEKELEGCKAQSPADNFQ